MTKKSRYYKEIDRQLLWGRAANRCSICHIELAQEANNDRGTFQIGEIAHIKDLADSGFRSDRDLTIEERNSYPNLILLCRNHHKEIDDLPQKYSVEQLRKIKHDHETWINNRLRDSALEISFCELETVIKAVAGNPGEPSLNLDLTPLEEKMARNELTRRTNESIMTGMIKLKDVSECINHISQIDIEFSTRLVNGFRKLYDELIEDGLRGDYLFDGLFAKISAPYNDFKLRSANLAVLVYLFEDCEVFEK